MCIESMFVGRWCIKVRLLASSVLGSVPTSERLVGA